MFKSIVKIIFLISIYPANSQTALIQKLKMSDTNDSFLQLRPNGSLLLRSTVENSSSLLQETMIFKTILNAIRLMSIQQQTRNTLNDLNQKIYGDGVEHKFPPFLERVIQRIQTYFSIYKYTDTSSNIQPVRDTTNETFPSSSPSSSSPTLSYDDYNEIDVNLTTSLSEFIKKNKTTIKPPPQLTTAKPTKAVIRTTTLRTTAPTTTTTANTNSIDASIDEEENEFIEIKNS